MDTRSKILTLAEALGLQPPLTIASGTFDVLRAEHARQLAEVRTLAAGADLLVVVLPSAAGVSSPATCAEMVAALRVVDYVVTADCEDLARLICALQPVEVVRFEAADELRMKQLREHVHRRQNS